MATESSEELSTQAADTAPTYPRPNTLIFISPKDEAGTLRALRDAHAPHLVRSERAGWTGSI